MHICCANCAINPVTKIALALPVEKSVSGLQYIDTVQGYLKSVKASELPKIVEAGKQAKTVLAGRFWDPRALALLGKAQKGVRLVLRQHVFCDGGIDICAFEHVRD